MLIQSHRRQLSLLRLVYFVASLARGGDHGQRQQIHSPAALNMSEHRNTALDSLADVILSSLSVTSGRVTAQS
nr:hypothetical protein CFP56_24340 [Quercus suber]